MPAWETGKLTADLQLSTVPSRCNPSVSPPAMQQNIWGNLSSLHPFTKDHTDIPLQSLSTYPCFVLALNSSGTR